MQTERPTKRPALPTPNTARASSLRRGAIVAITALACVALVSACGGSSGSPSTETTGTLKTPVNTARVAKSIEGTLLEKRHLHATVVCPATAPSEVGKTFECVASVRAVKAPHAITKSTFIVTIQNRGGYVTYVGQ